MKTITLLSLILISVIIHSCSGSSGKDESSIASGQEYNFSMTDSSGIKLADGVLKILKYDSGLNISGTYTFTKNHVSDFPGLSTMQGNCEGKFDKAKQSVWLNMNPKIADANVFVASSFKNFEMTGEWQYTTMKGMVNKGKFSAKLK